MKLLLDTHPYTSEIMELLRQWDPCTEDDIFRLEVEYRVMPNQLQYDPGSQFNAKAPAIYLDKQIDKVAPHKKSKRGKFKRSSRNK